MCLRSLATGCDSQGRSYPDGGSTLLTAHGAEALDGTPNAMAAVRTAAGQARLHNTSESADKKIGLPTHDWINA